ncbi:hypothetical protein [Sinimarinibacterium sp. NLF-5-8]|uniref:hypothetical protein n=1 Tax=Sinimarinibacterium sp. NLF-5-8 TaxID=2698684 RepID=UPI00137C34D1|nr:hypothetical protein [Sinimarinibacterium sp. NLF-5-8]QHS09080.1 hypothetical protein GT972_02230 [Sinimarinibacterium sp. NLF-5-8]
MNLALNAGETAAYQSQGQTGLRARARNAVLALMALGMSMQAMAGNAPVAGDPFQEFLDAVESYAKGALGIAICIVALLFGAIVGIGRNQPTAALSGVAFAIFIYFGPGMIKTLFSSGALI